MQKTFQGSPYRTRIQYIRGQVRAMVNAGNHNIRLGFRQCLQVQLDTVRRRARNGPGFYSVFFLQPLVLHQFHGPAHGQGMGHPALLLQRSGQHDLMVCMQGPHQCLDPTGLDAIIIGKQYSHLYSLKIT